MYVSVFSSQNVVAPEEEPISITPSESAFWASTKHGKIIQYSIEPKPQPIRSFHAVWPSVKRLFYFPQIEKLVTIEEEEERGEKTLSSSKTSSFSKPQQVCRLYSVGQGRNIGRVCTVGAGTHVTHISGCTQSNILVIVTHNNSLSLWQVPRPSEPLTAASPECLANIRSPFNIRYLDVRHRFLAYASETDVRVVALQRIHQDDISAGDDGRGWMFGGVSHATTADSLSYANVCFDAYSHSVLPSSGAKANSRFYKSYELFDLSPNTDHPTFLSSSIREHCIHIMHRRFASFSKIRGIHFIGNGKQDIRCIIVTAKEGFLYNLETNQLICRYPFSGECISSAINSYCLYITTVAGVEIWGLRTHRIPISTVDESMLKFTKKSNSVSSPRSANLALLQSPQSATFSPFSSFVPHNNDTFMDSPSSYRKNSLPGMEQNIFYDEDINEFETDNRKNEELDDNNNLDNEKDFKYSVLGIDRYNQASSACMLSFHPFFGLRTVIASDSAVILLSKFSSSDSVSLAAVFNDPSASNNDSNYSPRSSSEDSSSNSSFSSSTATNWRYVFSDISDAASLRHGRVLPLLAGSKTSSPQSSPQPPSNTPHSNTPTATPPGSPSTVSSAGKSSVSTGKNDRDEPKRPHLNANSKTSNNNRKQSQDSAEDLIYSFYVLRTQSVPDLVEEILSTIQPLVHQGSYPDSTFVQMLVEAHSLLQTKQQRMIDQQFGKGISIIRQLEYDNLTELLSRTYGLLGEVYLKLNKYKAAAYAFGRSNHLLRSVMQQLSNYPSALMLYLEIVLFSNQKKTVVKEDQELSNEILQLYRKYSPHQLSTVILESSLSKYSNDLAISLLEDIATETLRRQEAAMIQITPDSNISQTEEEMEQQQQENQTQDPIQGSEEQQWLNFWSETSPKDTFVLSLLLLRTGNVRHAMKTLTAIEPHCIVEFCTAAPWLLESYFYKTDQKDYFNENANSKNESSENQSLYVEEHIHSMEAFSKSPTPSTSSSPSFPSSPSMLQLESLLSKLSTEDKEKASEPVDSYNETSQDRNNSIPDNENSDNQGGIFEHIPSLAEVLAYIMPWCLLETSIRLIQQNHDQQINHYSPSLSSSNSTPFYSNSNYIQKKRECLIMLSRTMQLLQTAHHGHRPVLIRRLERYCIGSMLHSNIIKTKETVDQLFRLYLKDIIQSYQFQSTSNTLNQTSESNSIQVRTEENQKNLTPNNLNSNNSNELKEEQEQEEEEVSSKGDSLLEPFFEMPSSPQQSFIAYRKEWLDDIEDIPDPQSILEEPSPRCDDTSPRSSADGTDDESQPPSPLLLDSSNGDLNAKIQAQQQQYEEQQQYQQLVFEVQGLLCCPDLPHDYSRLYHSLQEVCGNHQFLGRESLEILCLASIPGKLSQVFHKLVEKRPNACLKLGKQYCKTAPDWKCLTTEIENVISSSNGSNKQAKQVYKKVLWHLCNKLPPNKFLELLPVNGNTQFFLKFIQQNFSLFQSNHLKENVIKKDQETRHSFKNSVTDQSGSLLF